MGTITCQRCGRQCRVNPNTDPDARLLKHAQQPKGLCANCAVTAFLQGVEPIVYAMRDKGPEILLDLHMRLQFASIMAAGCADMRPEEIHWPTVVENWGLAFPGKRQRQGRGR